MVQPEVMPVGVAIRFAHAVAQAVADRHGIRLLHIKGPAVDESLLDLGPTTDDSPGEPVPRHSTDADVWVDPEAVQRFLAAMSEHGWQLKVAFEDGSAFEHAATLGHAQLGYLDVHREFPGIGLDRQGAFERLWTNRTSIEIAGLPCWVPAVSAQRLVLLLHAARGGTRRDHPDIRRTWTDASEPERLAVRRLAQNLQAEVPLAGAIGELERFRGRREYWLWKVLSESSVRHSMVTIWAARVWAEPTPARAGRTAFRLLLPKPQRLVLLEGRAPTRRDALRAYWRRAGLAWRELRRLVRQ
ncbi:nucleotidyltransferase family protein [Granulicoccus sp. GXG6511]|uniref:nucleotidyltransferase family protein n=1 Tax=Granulicoccus sp. GXG6511 TaxID=3381351 RepID=UPI003D7E11A7